MKHAEILSLIEILQDAKKSLLIDKNEAAVLSALNAATDILANIED